MNMANKSHRMFFWYWFLFGFLGTNKRVLRNVIICVIVFIPIIPVLWDKIIINITVELQALNSTNVCRCNFINALYLMWVLVNTFKTGNRVSGAQLCPVRARARSRRGACWDCGSSTRASIFKPQRKKTASAQSYTQTRSCAHIHISDTLSRRAAR